MTASVAILVMVTLMFLVGYVTGYLSASRRVAVDLTIHRTPPTPIAFEAFEDIMDRYPIPAPVPIRDAARPRLSLLTGLGKAC